MRATKSKTSKLNPDMRSQVRTSKKIETDSRMRLKAYQVNEHYVNEDKPFVTVRLRYDGLPVLPKEGTKSRKTCLLLRCTKEAAMDGKPKEAKKVVPSERSIKIAVQIPEGESPEEWLAANSVFYALQLYSSTSAIDFYNQLNMLYGTLVERCTKESCPKMDAGTKYVVYRIVNLPSLKPLLPFTVLSLVLTLLQVCVLVGRWCESCPWHSCFCARICRISCTLDQ